MQTEPGCPPRRAASDGAEPDRRVLQDEIARCRREIEAAEAELRAGNPDVEGLCLALMDWSAELRILGSRPLPSQEGMT